MWIRKELSEVIRDRHKKCRSIKIPLLYASSIFIFSAIMIKIGYSKYSNPSIDPISWQRFFYSGIFIALILGISSFLLFYVWQLYTKRQIGEGRTTLICTNCYKTKCIDDIFTCDCGGEFVNFDEMKWVEDK